MTDKVNIAEIIERLEQLEAHNAIRNCINRYMEICDELNANTDLYELMNLLIKTVFGKVLAINIPNLLVVMILGSRFMTCSNAIHKRISLCHECTLCEFRTNLCKSK